MTKAEYESSVVIIKADKKLGHTNRMIELRYIDAEYIASLEAENAKLNRALDVAVNCMIDVERCVCDEDEINESEFICNDDCHICWLAYFMQRAEEDNNANDQRKSTNYIQRYAYCLQNYD